MLNIFTFKKINAYEKKGEKVTSQCGEITRCGRKEKVLSVLCGRGNGCKKYEDFPNDIIT